MFQAIWVIIGCLIGAGFASGKEIYLFFFKYGEKGIIGIVIATILFFYVILKSFKIIDWNKQEKKEIHNYKEFLKEIFPFRNKKIFDGMNSFVNFFILIEFFIMVSGFGAYMKQEFQIPTILGASLISLCTYVTCKKSMNGIEKANQIIVPVLILCIIHMGVKNVDSQGEIFRFLDFSMTKNLISLPMVLYAVLYTSYNIILLIPVLIGLKKEKQRNQNFAITLVSTWIVAVLAICVFRILSMGTIADHQSDIPVLKITRYYGDWYPAVYGIMIAISIYTSAIVICFSLLENLTIKKGKTQNFLLKMICISAVLFSFIGFSKLVETLYPLLGIFGILQIINLIRYKCK